MRNWLKDARKEAGMTCAQMAAALEISDIYYQFIESGRRMPNMTIDMAVKLSKVLRIPLESIIGFETR